MSSSIEGQGPGQGHSQGSQSLPLPLPPSRSRSRSCRPPPPFSLSPPALLSSLSALSPSCSPTCAHSRPFALQPTLTLALLLSNLPSLSRSCSPTCAHSRAAALQPVLTLALLLSNLSSLLHLALQPPPDASSHFLDLGRGSRRPLLLFNSPSRVAGVAATSYNIDRLSVFFLRHAGGLPCKARCLQTSTCMGSVCSCAGLPHSPIPAPHARLADCRQAHAWDNCEPVQGSCTIPPIHQAINSSAVGLGSQALRTIVTAHSKPSTLHCGAA